MRTDSPYHRSVRAMQEITGEKDADPTSFLPGSAIELILDEGAARTWAGQLTLSATANQLLRLNGILHDLFISLGADAPLLDHTLLTGPTLHGGLVRLGREISSRTALHFQPAPESRDVVRVALSPSSGDADVRLQADDWRARINWPHASPEPATRLPFGPLIGSSLAASEAFKHLLLENYGSQIESQLLLGEPITLSAYDYTEGGKAPAPPPSTIDLGAACIAGLGGGGSATLYALCATPDLQGSVAGVDKGHLEPSNGNRHLYATQTDLDEGRLKVDAAADFHRRVGGGFAFDPHAAPIDDYLSSLAVDPKFLVAMVDDVPARRGLQKAYDGPLVDAGVGDFGYALLRVYLGEGMCLGCKHPFLGDEDAATTAGLWGVTVDEARRLIRENPRVGRDLLADLSRTHSRDPEFFAHLRGLRFREARVDLECGEWAQDLQPDYAPSLPFLTALPGFLAAAELLKSRIAPDAQLNNVFHHNMLWVPKPGAMRFEPPRPRCSVRCT